MGYLEHLANQPGPAMEAMAESANLPSICVSAQSQSPGTFHLNHRHCLKKFTLRYITGRLSCHNHVQSKWGCDPQWHMNLVLTDASNNLVLPRADASWNLANIQG